MSIKEIVIHTYSCRCDLPECPGKGKPWIATKGVPKRCRYCKRLAWNGKGREVRKNALPIKYDDMTDEERREYNRKKKTESRARIKKEAGDDD